MIINTVIAGGGTTPTGTLPITSNGTYDVTDKAEAVVNVPTTAPAYYVEKTVRNGYLVSGTNIINLNGVSNIGANALYAAYYSAVFPANTNVDLSALTSIGGENACYNMLANCIGLTSVNLSGLTTISGANACYSMLSSCFELTSVDLSSLTTISGSGACTHMFSYCTGLISVNLPALTTISSSNSFNGAFSNCIGLISVKMNKLNVITQQLSQSYAPMFSACSKLESVELGGLTASTFASRVNQIQYLFDSNTGSQATNGCTVHFPSNFDPADPNHTFDASTLSGYPTFGGNASYIHVAFDLPATE